MATLDQKHIDSLLEAIKKRRAESRKNPESAKRNVRALEKSLNIRFIADSEKLKSPGNKAK